MRDAKAWLDRIHALPLPQSVRVMNVCGGHERTIAQAGLRAALPAGVDLIAGPGCPVCVCPEEDVFRAIQLALEERVTLVTFGDMLRVPVNVHKGEVRSLEQAKAAGADVRPLASPREAVRVARQHPDRNVVFFAAGFETTMAPVAALLAEGLPDNLSVLLSGRLTWPAVALLLDSEQAGFDALVAPGHVATVMGPEEWGFVVERHRMPVAIAGFTPASLLAALYSVLRQVCEQAIFLDNCYPEVVRPGGNPTAKALLDRIFVRGDAPWRGIGVIPDSGFNLAASLSDHDARIRYPETHPTARRRAGEMPPGCDCARVVLGKIAPSECRLYGRACTPRSPFGPCMVSDEGACHIWWASGTRAHDGPAP